MFRDDSLDGVAPLATRLPYLSYSDDNLLNMSESTGFLLSLSPTPYINEAITEGLLELLVTSLPDNSYLHACLWGSPYLADPLSRWAGHAASAPDILKTQTRIRHDHFLSALKSPWPGERGVVRQFMGYIGVSVAQHSSSHARLLSVRDKFVREFDNHAIATTPMSAEDFLFWTRTWLNMPPPEQSVDATWFPLTPLREQILSPASVFTQNESSLFSEHDDWQVTPLIATGFPEHFDGNEWAAMAGSAFNAWQQMNAPFAYHLMALRGQSKHDKTHAQGHLARTEKTLKYPWVPKLQRQQAFKDARYLSDALDTRDDGMVKVMVSSTVFSPKAQHAKAVSQLSALGQGRRFKWQPLPAFALPLYLMQCPLYGGSGMAALWARQGRFRTVTLSAMTHLLPICAPTPSPCEGMLLTGVSGDLFGFDNFNPTFNNYNLAITGPSGSGKSVFTQELIARHLSLPNRRVFVLDIGKSYEACCHVFGGQYIVSFR